MPQNKEVHKAYMRKYRQGSQKIGKGSQMREVSVEQAGKLLMICKALDKEVSGLHGKVNLLDHIRLGSLTCKEIRGIIEPKGGDRGRGEGGL